MNMFGDNHDCPLRITSFVGYNKLQIEDSAKRLVEQFGWKIHSRATLETLESTVYSIILFNTKGTLIEDLTKSSSELRSRI